MRADRLLSLLMLLQTHGRMTAKELAEHLEVSERTIYRDMEALSIAGIPVYAERGPGGGCSLIDGYQTRLTGLTETEVRAVFLSHLSNPLADLGLSKALDDALLKLSASLPAPQRTEAEQVRQCIYVDREEDSPTGQVQRQLQTLQDAMWQKRKVAITSRSHYGTLKQSLVAPCGLVSRTSCWYLVAMVAEDIQVFDLSELLLITLTEESFTRPEDFNLSTCWAAYREQVRAQQVAVYGYAAQGTRKQKTQVTPQPVCWSSRFMSAREKKASPAHRQNSKPAQPAKKTLYPQQKKAFMPLNSASTQQKKAKLKNPLKKTAFSPAYKKGILLLRSLFVLPDFYQSLPVPDGRANISRAR